MSVELCRRVLRAVVLAGLTTFGALPHEASAADSIVVVIDEAKLIRVPERAVTLVVGNPLIADVNVQPGGIMVVTGKGFGATNVLALDRSGTVVMDRLVEVVAPEKLVTVFRGVSRETYSCAPDCQRRVMIGDADISFGQTLGQTTSRAAAAATVAEQAQGKE
jgi:Flp pilus assembly secretin CpaC